MIYLSKRAKNYIDKKVEESGNITYIYDESWIKKRNRKKEKKVKKLEGSISDLRKQVREDLKSDDIKKKLSALAVGLIDSSYERVGNEASAEQNHFGVTTWRKKHISFSKGNARIKYVGKSGVKQDKEISQKNLVSALKELVKDKKSNDKIFQTEDFTLSANDVNSYLKKFKITAKDLRGFHANLEMRKALKSARKGKLPKDEKEKTKKLKEEFKKALEETAKRVGHEPSTLKSQYLIPSIEENYMAGKVASVKVDYGIEKLAKKIEHTSAILALMVPDNIVKKLKKYVDEDTMSSKDLHMTLLFLGRAEDLDDITINAIKKATEKVCARHEPLSMKISGSGLFSPGDDGTPVYIVPNAKGLSSLQADLENAIDNIIDLKSEHGWVPHITVNYSKDDCPEVPYLEEYPKWKANTVRLLSAGKKICDIPIGKKSFHLSKRAEEMFEEMEEGNYKDKLLRFIDRATLEGWTSNRYVVDNYVLLNKGVNSYNLIISIEIKPEVNLVSIKVKLPRDVEPVTIFNQTYDMKYSGSMNMFIYKFDLDDGDVFDDLGNRLKSIEETATNIQNKDDLIEDFLQNLIKNGYSCYEKIDIDDLYDNIEQVKSYLIKNLPPQFFIEENGVCLETKERNLPRHGEEERWLHVADHRVDNVASFINSFMKINGEVCFSKPEDIVFQHGTDLGKDIDRDFFAIVVDGPAEAVFNEDVWSDIDIFTGRRYVSGDPAEPRTEAWVIPNKTKLVHIVSNRKEILKQAKEYGEQHGIDTLPFYASAYTLSKEPIKEWLGEDRTEEEIEKEKYWEKAKTFEEGWADDMAPKSPGTQILIEPYDSAVSRALSQLPANIKNNITKVIVHPEGGTGQLGHVEMGPGKDPREVHIFKNRINEQVKRMFGTSQPNPQQLQEATHKALLETLMHEGIHIGPNVSQDQILQPNYRFKGESETERETSQKMKSLFPNMVMSASLKLDEIRNKYFPSKPMTEPDLEFTTYCMLNKKYNIVKKGIALLKDEKINPIVFQIENAIEYNKKAINNINVIRIIGNFDFNCLSEDGILKLACFQIDSGLEPTGILDKPTISKFKFDDLPRNFGVVVPGKLYRGGIFDNMEQFKKLKNMGVERIISLHNNPVIGRACKKMGLEHVVAPIETGSSEDYGRKILGDKISKLLLEKPTYVHCWFGADRTGGVIARFRTENGWTNKDAYFEAKSYGFKDMFADLIDWFSEIGKDPPPIDTTVMRKNCPYENPEIKERMRRMKGLNPDCPNKETMKEPIFPMGKGRMHRFNPNNIPLSSRMKGLNPDCPYKDLEVIEQDAFIPAGIPTDQPFGNSDVSLHYETWTDSMRNINPYSSITPPISINVGY